jgi:hypothetical protein
MRPVVLAAVGLVLATPAGAGAEPITATLTTSTRAPFAEDPWRYTVTVRQDSRAIAARMRLYVLRGPTVVRCLRGGKLVGCKNAARADWLAFRTQRSGVLRWPAALAGRRLVFQAQVKVGPTWIRLRAPVLVRRMD